MSRHGNPVSLPSSTAHILDGAPLRRFRGRVLILAREQARVAAAMGNGQVRNAQVAAQRLKNFKVRKDRFRKLRQAVGAQRTALVLRTGGTRGSMLLAAFRSLHSSTHCRSECVALSRWVHRHMQGTHAVTHGAMPYI